MNKLKTEKKEAVISALIEGNSIRSTERMFGVHRDTIMRLLVEVGTGCAQLLDSTMRNLTCQRIQADEIWCFVGKKERMVSGTDDRARVGDKWVWVGIDADTKLIPCYRVGQRTATDARAFMADLSGRLSNRVQLSTDSLAAYLAAVDGAFGADIDYGQIVKSYEGAHGTGRYSPPQISSVERYVISGEPEFAEISTSYVERQNLTMRMQMRRFTRLTNAFSKKVENLKAAVALHFAHYNFVRIHQSLRVTPAMAAGVSSRVWSIGDLVNVHQST
jgi:IS1 family transposase